MNSTKLATDRRALLCWISTLLAVPRLGLGATLRSPAERDLLVNLGELIAPTGLVAGLARRLRAAAGGSYRSNVILDRLSARVGCGDFGADAVPATTLRARLAEAIRRERIAGVWITTAGLPLTPTEADLILLADAASRDG
jgi:hypothetical protein